MSTDVACLLSVMAGLDPAIHAMTRQVHQAADFTRQRLASGRSGTA
jgi:hypothetical protein